ncbi:hypothetical protein C8258_27950 [Nocardia sp. MDA0666]|nr:hypothetical protein C8258_27950 [Nocardia sp. MDA0666]
MLSESSWLLAAVTAADRAAPSNSSRTVSVSWVRSADDLSSEVPRSSNSPGISDERFAIIAPATPSAKRILRVRPSK